MSTKSTYTEQERVIKSWRKRQQLLLILLFLCGGVMFSLIASWAQTNQDNKQNLESKKQKLEEEIAYNKKLLDETSKNKNISVSQLRLLKAQISSREALLDEINNGIDSINHLIRDNNQVLSKQEGNLESLKREYAAMIYQAWKMRSSYDRLLCVFSASTMDQAFQRMKYFQQYAESRQRQAEQINYANENIKQKMFELNSQRTEKEVLLGENATEVDRLDKEKEEQAKLINDLKKKESSIKKTINKKKEEARKLQKQIEAIIAGEIKKSSEITKKQPTANVVDVLTPEEKLLSDNFVSNKGKLPWPVSSGLVASTYGEHDHPVLAGIKIRNNGIDIATTKGMSVRAVFTGSVVSIISVSDINKVVIIRHGGYFTVYSNLQSVSVSKGSVVTTKQTIGIVATNKEENKTEVHFEVWEGESIQNPAYWIAPR